MRYTDCLTLINMSIKFGILKEEGEKVFIFRNEGKTIHKGWFLEDKHEVAKELMEDDIGQEVLIKALEREGFNF